MERNYKKHLDFRKKIYLFFVFFIFSLTINGFCYRNDKVFADTTFVVKNGDMDEAKTIHAYLYKQKKFTIKIIGASKRDIFKKTDKLDECLAKVNKYGVYCIPGEKAYKIKKKSVSIKINKECTRRYKETILILKKMKEYYLKGNVKSLKKRLKIKDGMFDKYELRLSDDKTAKPEDGTYEEGDKFEIYDLYYGDDNSILSIAYFPEKEYYDLADYGNFADDMEKGKYLKALVDIKKHYVNVGINAKHYKVDEDFMNNLREDVKLSNDAIDEEKKKAEEAIKNLSEDALPYLTNKKYKNKFIACSRIKNNDFCDISNALKIYMISKCFFCDQGSGYPKNPFIKYDEAFAESTGGVVYHYNDDPKKFYFMDYEYEGDDIFFKRQKKGRVSSVLKQLRKGKVRGVCIDYATVLGYLYEQINIEHYFGYSEKASHGIVIVRAKNSEGKSFWVYQNYDMLSGANQNIVIAGPLLKAKTYVAIGASKKKQKQIRKTKFSMSDFN